MITYILKRFLQSFPVIFGVLTISFIISYIIPGDPVLAMVGDFFEEETIEKIRYDLGLNKPILFQYFTYIKNTLNGNFGVSFQTKSAVIDLIIEKFSITFTLAILATIFASIIGIIIGLISSIKYHTLLDRIFIFLSIGGISAPIFWVAIILILWFGIKWNILPPTGYGGMVYYILPVITLGTRSLAMIARNTRIFMLEIIKQDDGYQKQNGFLAKFTFKYL